MAHTYDPCSLEDCHVFRIGCASQQVPGRQVQVYKVCEVQVDEVSEMRRDDTQAQERKEV